MTTERQIGVVPGTMGLKTWASTVPRMVGECCHRPKRERAPGPSHPGVDRAAECGAHAPKGGGHYPGVLEGTTQDSAKITLIKGRLKHVITVYHSTPHHPFE